MSQSPLPLSVSHRFTKLSMRAYGLIFLTAFLSSGVVYGDQGIDSFIDTAVQPITDTLASVVFYSVNVFGTDIPLVVAWLVAAAVYFTLSLNFLNVRGFFHAVRLVRGDYSRSDAPGEVTHFQALATAVSGTVGIGNIGGVAIAITAGGPGATFWMIMVGLFGMATKFVECTLGVKYRTVLPSGVVSGGPMYYLSRGMSERGMGGLGKFLAVGFALMCILATFGAGNS